MSVVDTFRRHDNQPNDNSTKISRVTLPQKGRGNPVWSDLGVNSTVNNGQWPQHSGRTLTLLSQDLGFESGANFIKLFTTVIYERAK